MIDGVLHSSEVGIALGRDAEFRIRAHVRRGVGGEPELGLKAKTGRAT